MSVTPIYPDARGTLDAALKILDQTLPGREFPVRLALATLLGGGHLLIEDIPGTGKTRLAETMAALFDLTFRRVQMTSDLLPSDITGSSVYDPKRGLFVFHEGPLFANILVADEINRAPPRTQSAMLEAMADRRVTENGTTRHLPEPFMVIATANPVESVGVFPMPESELDRFMMRLSLGFPPISVETAILMGETFNEKITPVGSARDLKRLQDAVKQVRCSKGIAEAIVRALWQSRKEGKRLSIRAGLAVRDAARAWALIHDRDYITPDDLQVLDPHVFGHR